MKKIKLLCAAGLLGALAMTSCTDLTEKVHRCSANHRQPISLSDRKRQ